MNIVKFLRTSVLKNICKQLLLKFNESFFWSLNIIIHELVTKNIFHVHFIKRLHQCICHKTKKWKSLNQIASMVLQIILCDISEKRKTGSQSWRYELDEGCSLLQINCSLWTYKGVNNKLFWFSWSIFMVVK